MDRVKPGKKTQEWSTKRNDSKKKNEKQRTGNEAQKKTIGRYVQRWISLVPWFLVS
jgi:hypothetical protein